MSGPAGAGSPERAGLRILLVEDDPAMARLVQQVLRAHGFTSSTHVGTGHAALVSAADADVVASTYTYDGSTGRSSGMTSSGTACMGP